MKIGYKVGDAMTTKPSVVSPDTSVEEAAKIMAKEGIGSLVVCQNGELVGIITEKDFVERVVAKGLNVGDLKVKDIMTKKVYTASPDDDLIDAIRLMARMNVKRLPVVNEGKFVGFVTAKDILAIQPDLLELLTQRFKLRELERKPAMLEGQCSKCGNFTLVRRKDNELICYDCLEKIKRGAQ